MDAKVSEIKRQNKVVIEGVCIIRHVAKNDKWEVDAGLKLGGTKKHRKRFKSKERGTASLVNNLKVKLRNQGTSAFKLTTAQQVDAEQALKALEETKVHHPTPMQLSSANRYLPESTFDRYDHLQNSCNEFQ